MSGRWWERVLGRPSNAVPSPGENRLVGAVQHEQAANEVALLRERADQLRAGKPPVDDLDRFVLGDTELLDHLDATRPTAADLQQADDELSLGTGPGEASADVLAESEHVDLGLIDEPAGLEYRAYGDLPRLGVARYEPWQRRNGCRA